MGRSRSRSPQSRDRKRSRRDKSRSRSRSRGRRRRDRSRSRERSRSRGRSRRERSRRDKSRSRDRGRGRSKREKSRSKSAAKDAAKQEPVSKEEKAQALNSAGKETSGQVESAAAVAPPSANVIQQRPKAEETEIERKQRERRERLARFKELAALKKDAPPGGAASATKASAVKGLPQVKKASAFSWLAMTSERKKGTKSLEDHLKEEEEAERAKNAAPAKKKVAEEDEVDPLDAFMSGNNKEALKEIKKAQKKQKEENAMRAAGLVPECDKVPEVPINYDLHCYVCKRVGHTKAHCPQRKCFECGEVGHEKGDCKVYEARIVTDAIARKKEVRQIAYKKKKRKKQEEWAEELRKRTGIDGFAALYRVLGLDPRRLATEGDLSRAYKKMALIWHPDKNPDDREKAEQKFLEIKAAYELLLEGIRTGGKGMKGAVFKGGDLAMPGQTIIIPNLDDIMAVKGITDEANPT